MTKFYTYKKMHLKVLNQINDYIFLSEWYNTFF